MAQSEQDSGKTYADIWGEAVHSNRHLRVLSMALAGAVLAWLAGRPATAQTGATQVDRAIDGDTILDQAAGWSGWAGSGVRCREEG